jgi:predicted ATPase
MSRREQVRPAPSAPAHVIPARSNSGVRERVARTNLAQPSTRFVGRRRELSELRTMLAEHRLVTVVGAAGIGKTRLACELARLLADEYLTAGGVWRVDLAEARDGDEVCAALARALGLGATSPGRSATATIGAALAARGRTLVVLDAAEGCAAPLARSLQEWMPAAPNVEWIVSSRARLGLHGEGVLELGPVATTALGGGAPDAVWLFVDRARASRTDIMLDEHAALDVSELVRRLDGVPLSIELAAARVRTWTPAQMLERMQRPPSAEPAPRTTALDDAMQAAWAQLDPWQKDALAQFSVFAGGFDLEGAEGVLDLSHHGGVRSALDAIESLRDRALLALSSSVEEAGRVRFWIPRSVRQFARERLLEVGGREAALLRHARHYTAVGHLWAERFETSNRASEAIWWLTREAENLLAVHRRFQLQGRQGAELAASAALAIDPLLATVGPGSLRLGLLDAALSSAAREGIDSDVHIRVLEARAETHRSLARAPEAVADAQAALTLASSSGSRRTVGRVLRTLATLALAQGRLVEGRGLAEQACAVDRETGERREEARAFGLLGSVGALEGDLEGAWSTLERAIAMHREAGDLRFEAIDTGNLAVVAHDAGRLVEARAHAERALVLCQQAANARLEGEVLGLLASIAHESDLLDEARASYERALRIHRETANRRGEGTLLSHYGVFLAETDDLEGARASYARALGLLRECRDRPNEAFVLGALAALEARERSLDSARAALTHASECLEGSSEPRARAALNLWRGHLELALARDARADGDDSRAAMLIEAASARVQQSEGNDRGQVRRVGDVRLARRALSAAIAAVRRGDSVPPSDRVECPPSDAPADALVVCSRGRWFRAPGCEVVSVARWRPLQRLLERLAERREIAPGEPLAVEALVAAGWPGERMLSKAGATRVYTAIASLRRLGLKGMLVRDERGYLLRADVPISRVSRH